MPTAKKARSNPKAVRRSQQGARGRAITETEGPVLVPRASKVPAQDSDFLTTPQGQRLEHTDDSLKAGPRGPTLMEDFHLREKVMHFDHERIPERVVHARGAGGARRVRGVRQRRPSSRAPTSCSRVVRTPVFTRFSTVVGSRGSADTVRDVRGFAVKFYTDEGVFDLVGNNIPVFFIRDGIKFPDLIHAAKPEPDREIPQAQTAHTTFWDFVSMIPESPHMLMWVMSDRAIPRSYRMMEGFGVHTFRLVNADGGDDAREVPLEAGARCPRPGVGRSADPQRRRPRLPPPRPLQRDRRRRVPRVGARRAGDARHATTSTSRASTCSTRRSSSPRSWSPVQPIGRLTLNRNPTNFFAETEQVAFHVGHLVRGIEVVDDPLMQARLFSYLDTQLTRLGGPNFSQIPINRPHRRPSTTTTATGSCSRPSTTGARPYLPNAVGGGCPFLAGDEDGGYVHVPREVHGPKVRERGPDDEYAQATLFWQQHDRGRAGPHRRRVHVRARQGRRPRGGRTHGRTARARRRRARRPRLRRPRACQSPVVARRRRTAEPADDDVPDAPAGSTRRRRWRWSPTTPSRSTGGSCRSSPTTAPTSPASASLQEALARRRCRAARRRHPQGRDRRRRRRNGRRAHRRPVVPHRQLGRGRRDRRSPAGAASPSDPAVLTYVQAATGTTRRSRRGATASSCSSPPACALDAPGVVTRRAADQGVRRRRSSTRLVGAPPLGAGADVHPTVPATGAGG